MPSWASERSRGWQDCARGQEHRDVAVARGAYGAVSVRDLPAAVDHASTVGGDVLRLHLAHLGSGGIGDHVAEPGDRWPFERVVTVGVERTVGRLHLDVEAGADDALEHLVHPVSTPGWERRLRARSMVSPPATATRSRVDA